MGMFDDRSRNCRERTQPSAPRFPPLRKQQPGAGRRHVRRSDRRTKGHNRCSRRAGSRPRDKTARKQAFLRVDKWRGFPIFSRAGSRSKVRRTGHISRDPQGRWLVRSPAHWRGPTSPTMAAPSPTTPDGERVPSTATKHVIFSMTRQGGRAFSRTSDTRKRRSHRLAISSCTGHAARPGRKHHPIRATALFSGEPGAARSGQLHSWRQQTENPAHATRADDLGVRSARDPRFPMPAAGDKGLARAAYVIEELPLSAARSRRRLQPDRAGHGACRMNYRH